MAAIVSSLLGQFFGSFFDFFGVVGTLFMSGGWLIFLYLAFVIFYKTYMNTIQTKFLINMKWVFLKVRVPEENTRNPRSMEEALNAIHGIHKSPDLLEIYLDGFIQPWFSMEIRARAGEVTFLMRVLEANSPIIQAAIYAQYPDAEIEEVKEDYMDIFPQKDLEKTYDCWGTEEILDKPDFWPIKTYIDFEDQYAEDSKLVDPMAAVTEYLGILKPGEEIWLQIVARPAFRKDWSEKGKAEAFKIAGREIPKKLNWFEQSMQTTGKVVSAIVPIGPGEEKKKDSKTDLGIMKLTPGEVDNIKAIQRAVGKVVFECLVRIVYVAEKPIYNHRARIPAMLGMFRQYTGSNNFKPNPNFTTSRPVYAFVKSRRTKRKQRLMRRFRLRYFAEEGQVLNTEELATMYHYPVVYTKTPILDRARAKRGEAPANVPFAPDDLPLG